MSPAAAKQKPKKTTDGPFADTPFVQYLSRQIDAAQVGGKTQADIARELGYTMPNVISMFKQGRMKVPLNKIVPLARALNVEPAHMFRMGMQQFMEDEGAEINAIFGTILTKNEVEIINTVRAASKNSDPAMTRDQERELKAIFR